MVALIATANANTIHWGVVEYEGTFTKAQASDTMRRAQQPVWSPTHQKKRAIATAPNDDIAAGNLKKFKNIQDMLDSLHAE